MGASILIVEDEAVLATDLAESLKDHGYEVLDVVSTGEEAVEKSLELKPQIVLVDIHLKGHLDGIQAAQQIREILDIPVIYLTAYTDSNSLERAKLTEPHGYLVKPVDDKELRITLEMALYKSHAEKQLRESEEFNRRLVEHSPMGILYLSKYGKIEYANPAANSILTFPNEEGFGFIGLNIFDLPFVNHVKQDQGHFKLLLNGEQLSEVEFTYRSSDNNLEKILLVSAAPRVNSEGLIDGAIFMFVDITDRKRIEQALQKSEERLQLAVEGGGLGLWDWDLQTGQVAFNKRWAEMLEYDRDELNPHISTWQFLTHPDDIEIAIEAVQALFDGRTPIYEAELRRKTKSGDWRWILSRGRIVERDHNGQPLRAAGTVLDITDKKRAEEELEISERRFRTLVETARDVIWTVDLNLRYSYVSPSITELLGYSVDEMMSIDPMETLSPESRERVINAFQEEINLEMKQFRDRYTVRIEEIEQYKKDGSKIWVDLTTTFLRDHDGRPVGILGISHDVTNRKIAEQQLQEAHDKLEERVKERTKELQNTNKKLLKEIAERERTAEALRESEEKFRAIFETARDCIFIKDRDLKYVQINPAFEELFQMTAKEIVELRDEELFGSEAGLHIREADALVLAGETVEEDHTKPVGEDHRTFHIIKVPMRDKSGEVVGICGIARDITERKQNEEALRREKENLANVLEAMEDGVYIADDQYTIQYLNKSLQNEFGSVRGQRCYQYFHGAQQPCQQCVMPPKLNRRPMRFEWSSHRNGRTYDQVDTTLKNADRTLSKLQILRDITNRKKAEAATKHLAELQQLVAALSTSFINLPPEDIDNGIHEALQKIGQFAEVDRSYVFLLSGDNKKVINTHEWSDEGIEPLIEKRKKLRVDNVPYLLDKIINKETVHVPSVSDLKAHGSFEKQALEAFNIKSLILAPMLSKGSVRGFIGIESLKTEGAWPSGITGLMNIVADMFSNALDRMRTEQALRDSERKFRELAELLPAFVTETDTVGTFTFVNKACLEVIGYSWEDFWAGINAIDIVNPEDWPRLANNVVNLIGSQDYSVDEYEIVRKDGTKFPVVSYSAPVVRDGKLAGIRSVSIDITERKKAEEALRRSEQRFRAIFEGAQDAIFIKDQRLRYTEVNPAMEKILGMKSSEIIGKTDQKIFDLRASKHLLEIDRRVLNGEVIEEEHTRIVNGTTLTFLDIKVPLEDPNGRIVGICGISRNITERKKATPAEPMVAEAYRSKAMRTVLAQARIAAARGSVILLLGESGSGKDYLARWIHNHSPRASGPYFSLNCAAISKQLAESELFGHEAGAFTGARGRKKGLLELAEGGTLLLNEIGELPLALQSKLLTFLDTKSFLRVGGEKHVRVDARLIAATHRELEKEISEGRFLEPLFYRLNVFTITVPPLRERTEDMPILVEELLSKLAQSLQLAEVPLLDASDLPNLAGYQWPGNVRELRNVLERALLLWEGGKLEIPFPGRKQKHDDRHYRLIFRPDQTLKELHEIITRWACIEALRHSGGNRKQAAKTLGISRESIHRHIRRLGIKEEASA